MKKFLWSFLVPVLVFLSGVSCNNIYQTQSLQHQSYRVSDSIPNNGSLQLLLQPYHIQVNKTMNMVIGTADQTLERKQPEGTLGNFMVDAFFSMAAEKFNTKVDVAFVNSGGIRLTQLPAGNVTRGKIFELMPFDNLLVLQELPGTVLQQFLDLTASSGGWSVAGMTMQIKNLPGGKAGKKAVNVMIAGKPLDPNTIYTSANSNYLANGGDNADMLRNIPQISNGYLVRDALFDYIKKQGNKISAKIANRVSHAQ